MVNKLDIERWEKGKDHWNKWAEDLLDERSALKTKGLWTLNRKGEGLNTETRNWIKKASVDFSGQHFDKYSDFSNLIFPCVKMIELDDLHPNVVPNNYTTFEGSSLEAANFSNTTLSGINFKGAHLRNAHFHSSIINGRDFHESILSGADLSWATITHCSFDEVNLSGANFSGNDLRTVSFTKAILDNAEMSETNLEGGKFSRASLKGANLSSANLQRANFENANCTGTNFVNSKLKQAKFISSESPSAVFDKANLEGATFQAAKLDFASFENATLIEAHFGDSTLSSANFVGAILYRAKFSRADLNLAKMLGASFDQGTKFDQDPQVAGLSVDRYALECLDNYGELSVGARMKLDIHDDVATLRSYYSGYKQWIHLAAFVGFIFPYAWFITKQWTLAKFMSSPTDGWMPLWKAFFRFIYNGGDGWQQGWDVSWSFFFFVVALIYNILRALLLAKTKRLELAQESSGLPAAFSLNDKLLDSLTHLSWRNILVASKIGFFIYLMVVFFNLWHFFSMMIPV